MEKIRQLRMERAIETDPARKFQLKQQIQNEEAELDQLG
jgi:hypothetical protein